MPWIFVNGNGTRRRTRRRTRSYNGYASRNRRYRSPYSYMSEADPDAAEYYDQGFDDGPDDGGGSDDEMFDGNGRMALYTANGNPVRLEIASTPNDMLPPRAQSDQWANLRRRARF